MHACDRQTDRRTDGQNYDSQDRPRRCSRGKNSGLDLYDTVQSLNGIGGERVNVNEMGFILITLYVFSCVPQKTSVVILRLAAVSDFSIKCTCCRVQLHWRSSRRTRGLTFYIRSQCRPASWWSAGHRFPERPSFLFGLQMRFPEPRYIIWANWNSCIFLTFVNPFNARCSKMLLFGGFNAILV